MPKILNTNMGLIGKICFNREEIICSVINVVRKFQMVHHFVTIVAVELEQVLRKIQKVVAMKKEWKLQKPK